MTKIDITSTAIEKGLDSAKSFLDKLINPSIEEIGLLLKDKVALWRFKNQVKMVNKASEYCIKNNIKPREIPLKILCPLLEYSSLEEDETLQDKWSILLSNLADSEINIQNHVFPYLLSQISIDEFELIESTFISHLERKNKILNELDSFRIERPMRETELNKNKESLKQAKNTKIDSGVNLYGPELRPIRDGIMKIESELKSLERIESNLVIRSSQPAYVPIDELEEFETANLLRLGLIQTRQETYANSQTLEIPMNTDYEFREYSYVDLEVELDSEEHHILNELGQLFIRACQEKNTASNK